MTTSAATTSPAEATQPDTKTASSNNSKNSATASPSAKWHEPASHDLRLILLIGRMEDIIHPPPLTTCSRDPSKLRNRQIKAEWHDHSQTEPHGQDCRGQLRRPIRTPARRRMRWVRLTWSDRGNLPVPGGRLPRPGQAQRDRRRTQAELRLAGSCGRTPQVKGVGEPGAGEPHARLDGGSWSRSRLRQPKMAALGKPRDLSPVSPMAGHLAISLPDRHPSC